MTRFHAVLGALAALAVSACTNEEIVYVERAPFNAPPDSAAGLLGYYTAAEKQTTCGNCHVSEQGDWKNTAHSHAWSDLQASPNKTGTCNGCHSVTERGNTLEGFAGLDKVASEAYYDVQCESCHGAGFEHVNGKPIGPFPLARFRVVAETDQAGCAECHQKGPSGHTLFVEEWSQSRHAEILPSQAGRVDCAPCHEARAALQAWGSTANYLEKDSTGAPSYFPATTCGLCHDPHGSPNTKQLRFPIDVASAELNLCVKCHLRRDEPPINSSRNSPHAPQGGVFYGTAGYRNPTYFVYDTQQVATTHASAIANPRQCAGCHVVGFNRVDPLTGEVVFSTGHTFRPIPCMVGGLPVADNSCGYTVAERSWKSCETSGCHAPGAAQSVFTGSRNLLKNLVDVVWVDLDGDEAIDAYPTDTGWLAEVKLNLPTEFTVDAIITPAEGAEFNAKTVGELYGNGDKSLGVHNAFLERALIQANIQEMQVAYGFLRAPPPEIQRILAQPLPGAKRTNALRVANRRF